MLTCTGPHRVCATGPSYVLVAAVALGLAEGAGAAPPAVASADRGVDDCVGSGAGVAGAGRGGPGGGGRGGGGPGGGGGAHGGAGAGAVSEQQYHRGDGGEQPEGDPSH